MFYGDMEYKGFHYSPDILEDEDTRKYVHTVYHDGVCIGTMKCSGWYPAKFEDFKEFVEKYIQEHE